MGKFCCLQTCVSSLLIYAGKVIFLTMMPLNLFFPLYFKKNPKQTVTWDLFCIN